MMLEHESDISPDFLALRGCRTIGEKAAILAMGFLADQPVRFGSTQPVLSTFVKTMAEVMKDLGFFDNHVRITMRVEIAIRRDLRRYQNILTKEWGADVPSFQMDTQDALLGALHQTLLARAANHENRASDVATHLDRVIKDTKRALEGTAGDAT